MKKIGVLSSLLRYPVKSFGGENVESTRVLSYGVYGDRSHVIVDESRQGKYLTITQYQEMAAYQAAFVGEEKEDTYPELQIHTANGERYGWTNGKWRRDLQLKSGRDLSFHSFTPSFVPIGAIEEAPLLLVTHSSLQYLSKQLGKMEIDAKRFRPNLIIHTDLNTPFSEHDWISNQMKIGEEVVIEVTQPCERCMIITVDPKNGQRTPNIHKEIIRTNHNYFGVYAKVIQTGKVKLGDEIWLVND
ncbi:MOSC domain-containing protein [Cytobacillus sp. FSL K6-0265]|uniref:MOSC domain-containing protein n=1 Tax=Cytobacillus sp. FSL K6-0265 TaxID=2921448 RepID=UPI0030FAC6AA